MSYDWLTIHPDGSYEMDLKGVTGAEADRRLVIMQELREGRLRLPEQPEVEPPRLSEGDALVDERVREAVALHHAAGWHPTTGELAAELDLDVLTLSAALIRLAEAGKLRIGRPDGA